MSRAILLDSGPVGLVTNPRGSSTKTACLRWITAQIRVGSMVTVPEIVDFEVRRELIRAGRVRGLAHLDDLSSRLEYLPLTTGAMRQAAELWARARQGGHPTAPDSALDFDVILAAQALTCGEPDVIVATTNVAHLNRFVRAELWQNIPAA